MKPSRPQPPQVLFSSAERGWSALNADLVQIYPGRSQAPGGDAHMLGMHFGRPVHADCCVGGRRSRGVQKQGDIGVVPAGTDGAWEDDAPCQILRMRLRPSLLEEVAEQLGRNTQRVELTPRFHLRDTRMEAIGWAIKADLEEETPSDPLYIDLLANALAVRLIEIGDTSHADPKNSPTEQLSPRQLRTLMDFIEANLDQKLRLADLASVAGMSATRLKTTFRNSTGTPVHRYVMGRRMEYARALLATTTMPASQVALAAGFAHQSHLSATMRRFLGRTPNKIARPQREF
jgi:AraC family transcriptional regulator